MQVILNGKPHVLSGALTVQELTEQLKLSLSQIAVERNREIVPKSRYGEVMLSDGDEVEIVRLIGGG